MNKKKLLISTVVTNEVNTYETGIKSIPYAGIYVISEKGYDLKIAKKGMFFLPFLIISTIFVA